MADTAPSRFGPAWVWLIGLLIVGIGIALLIDWVGRDGSATVGGVQPGAEASPEAVAEAMSGGAEAGGAEVEADRRRAAIAEVEHGSAPAPLGALTPLGPAHTGANVVFEGRAVAVLDEGLWLDTLDGATIFVRVVDANGDIVAEGAGLSGRGIVRHDPIRVGGWIDEAELDETERTGLVSGYYIETTVSRLRGR